MSLVHILKWFSWIHFNSFIIIFSISMFIFDFWANSYLWTEMFTIYWCFAPPEAFYALLIPHRAWRVGHLVGLGIRFDNFDLKAYQPHHHSEHSCIEFRINWCLPMAAACHRLHFSQSGARSAICKKDFSTAMWLALMRAFTVYTLYDILKYMLSYMNTHTHRHKHHIQTHTSISKHMKANKAENAVRQWRSSSWKGINYVEYFH